MADYLLRVEGVNLYDFIEDTQNLNIIRGAGLFVLLMRDLIEGDIFPGFGRSKGFGRCTAEVTEIIFPKEWPKWEDDFIDKDNLKPSIFLNDEQKMILASLIENLIKEVKSDVIS